MKITMCKRKIITHRIHGAAIYGNIYHQYTPNVSIYIYIYTSTMDPMGHVCHLFLWAMASIACYSSLNPQ